ncbi:MAG: glycosyltransferase [Proteobacteria bacterium]|nr:glycosyltransferase [Pseudomonadota bacterium]
MISDVYFPRVNGVSTSIETFRHDLHDLGIATALIAPDYAAAPAPAEPDVIRIPARFLPLDPEDRMMRLAPIRELTARLREQRYDLIHIQTPFVAHYAGIELADALGVPRIETYHTFFEEYLFHYVPFLPRRWLRGFARRFSRIQGNQVDALIVPSRAMRERLAQYGVRRPMHVLPTGIPLARFAGGDGAAFRARFGIAPGRPTVAYVGRVAFEKNIDFLLRATALARRSVPDLLLVVTGEGPALKSLKRLARRLRIEDNVLFVGYLDRRSGLVDGYCAADAFVFASRTETQGLVLLEAMALGVPVVSTAVMGTRDILDAGRGALVSADNEEDFASQMVRLLQNGELRARLALEARDYAQEWNATTMARRLTDFYRTLLPSRSEETTEATDLRQQRVSGATT